MKKILHIFSLIPVVAVCSSCTAGLEQSVKKLERSVADLRAYQAEQTETINAMDSQLKVMSGRLEELEFSQNKRIGTDLSALRADLTSLRKRVPPPSIVPASELEVDEVWANSLPPEVGATFLDGLSRLREAKYTEAISLLQDAAEKLDGNDKAGVVLFWQGVAYDGASDDRGALRAYSEVVSRYPRSPRAPSSLLRQSSVFMRFGDSKTAALSLKKLIDDYPRAPEAERAKEKLRELK
jgi:TolA-binding protein